jgi:hypothetical protein
MRPLPIAILALLIALAPPIGQLAHSSLVFHMLGEHVLLLGAGWLVAADAGRHRRWRPPVAGLALPLALVAVLVVLLGHVSPALFGDEVASAPLAAAGHGAYVSAGFLLRLALPAMHPLGRALLIIWSEASMGLLVLGMLSGALTYPGYPPQDSAAAGLAMLVGMQGLWLAVPLGRWLVATWDQRVSDVLSASAPHLRRRA